MPFDINNGYSGNLYGRDRVGHTTPDAEAGEALRPWLPVPYPAPYLPTKRQDQGHPVLASIVFSSQNLVGLDKSGAFVPAGLFCGTQADHGASTATNAAIASDFAVITATNKFTPGQKVTLAGFTSGFTVINGVQTISSASSSEYSFRIETANVASAAQTGTATPVNAGQYCALKYSQADVGFAYNAITGNLVAAAGEVAVLAAPSDGAAGDVITFADGSTYTVTSGDVTNAQSCNLFDLGSVKPIGVALRNVFQYLGGVTLVDTTGGMHFTLNGQIPTQFKVHNYMHEMGTAVQTEYVLRLPWIGATLHTLQDLATADGLVGYTQGNYSRSFVHFTGASGSVDGTLAHGNLVVAATGEDAGNYAPYNSAVNSIADIAGRIIGIQNMFPIRDYANRVRTLWDPGRLVGPIKDPNPSSIMMGGSATGGIDYQLNLGTDGAFKRAYDQGKTVHNEYTTYVLVKISL